MVTRQGRRIKNGAVYGIAPFFRQEGDWFSHVVDRINIMRDQPEYSLRRG
jgi:hypothetical protein